MSEPILEMRGITKKFGRVTANDAVDLSIYPGEIHAILGENGAGKSTLMNVLLGIYKPNAGEILYKGATVEIRSPRQAVELGIGMVHQHFHLVETLTAAENVFLYTPECRLFLSPKEMEEKVAACSQKFHLEVDPHAFVWQLSVGEQQRVEIVKLLYRGAEILILDEPSAVLTESEASEMFRTLRAMAESGKSVVVISHKIREVMEFADRITVMKKGKVEDAMTASEASVERLTKAIVGDQEFRHEMNTGSSCTEEVVLSVKGISARNSRGAAALKNVSFDLRKGEILGIAGVAGNGQKELAEAICGLQKLDSGSITLEGKDITSCSARDRIDKKISFIPEDRRSMGLVLPMTVDENRVLKEYRTEKFSRLGILKKKEIAKTVDEEVERHRIRTAGRTAPVSLMSGGNQQKLIVSREIGSEPKVLVACYPSRGLDMGASDKVRAMLLSECEKGTAVLLVSEELEELFQLSDRIGVLCGGEMMAILPREEADVETIGKLMSGERI